MSTTEGVEFVHRILPEDWHGIVPTAAFFDEARRIVQTATAKGVVLRIMGGMGIALRSADQRDFAQRLGRVGAAKGQEYSDLDFAGYMKQRDQIARIFAEESGYIKRRTTLSSAASQRQIYFHPKGWFYVDVLLDKLLIANHPIDFKGRLELDPLTLAPSDLLLEKLQMWEVFGEKDLKDCMLLLKSHKVGEGDGDSVDSTYIAKLLSDDWGFWYTVTSNLRKIKRVVENLDELGPKLGIDPSNIKNEDRSGILLGVEALSKRIEEEPKSMSWKIRSKLGTAKRWYEHVETPESVGGFGIWHMKDVFPT